MSYRLKQNRLGRRLLSYHPDWIPTFGPILLGLTLLIVGLGVLDGWTPQMLVLIFLAFCTIFPLPTVRAATLIGLGTLLIGLLHGDGLLTRQSIELGSIAMFGTLIGRFLRGIEWRLARSTVLATLPDTHTTATPDTLISQTVTLLRDFARADAAIALRQLDEVTAQALVCLPPKALPNELTTPRLFESAIAQNRCLYYNDYPSTPGASHILLAQGTQSLAVLPLQYSESLRGAILLIWYCRTNISSHLRHFIESLLGELRVLLQFSDTTISLDRLQARFGAMLETIHQGVVFVDESGEQGWLNQTAAKQLGLPPGTVEPPLIAQAMATLRTSADNQTEITSQAAQFFSYPQAEIRNWNWVFTQPQPKVLSISSTPTRVRDVLGRLWLLDDITEQYFGQLALFERSKELSQANEELQRQNLRSQLFADVTLKIRQSLQIEDILQTTVAEVQKLLQADRVLIFRLWSNGHGQIVTEAVVPEWPSLVGQKITDEYFGSQYLKKYRQGRIYTIADIEKAEVEPCLVEFMQQFCIKAKLVMPILLKEELWGLLIAHQCASPRQWSSFETEILQQLADQIGIALAQAQLLEQETRQRQELASSNAQLQQFASIASHDLQEPLRKIQAFGNLLKDKYGEVLTEQGHDYLERMQNAAQRMQALINGLLKLSRIMTRAQPFVPVNLAQVTREVLSDLEVRIQQTGGRVEVGDLLTIDADPVQMRQLLQNLIGNALKFHKDEETPVVKIYSQFLIDSERQSAKDSGEADLCQIIIEDNGIGFDKKYLDRIFNVFQRLHSRSEYEGTGMGLAICRKIAERHSGSITAKSTPGRGATFIVTLPIKQHKGDSE